MSDIDVQVFDMVRREGPISLRELTECMPVHSRDQIYSEIKSLEDDQRVVREAGSLEKHSTTADVWTAAESETD